MTATRDKLAAMRKAAREAKKKAITAEAREAYRVAIKKGWWDGAPGLCAGEWIERVAGFAATGGIDRERAFAEITAELPHKFHKEARAMIADVYAQAERRAA